MARPPADVLEQPHHAGKQHGALSFWVAAVRLRRASVPKSRASNLEAVSETQLPDPHEPRLRGNAAEPV